MSRVLFRLDVSPFAGLGHLKRCLALAQELSEAGAENYFLCRTETIDLSPHRTPFVAAWTECVWSLSPEEDAREVVRYCQANRIDFVVIDHYRADSFYQSILYEAGLRWLQFDGAAHFPFWADWILNMSPGATEDLYKALTPRKDTRLLLGPRYAVLRREFQKWPSRTGEHRPGQKILLTFGGGDDRGATIFCLEAIRSIEPDLDRVILLSSANARQEEIVNWCRKEGRANTTVVLDAVETAPYMASAGLAISSGGMTTFEMARLGVPLLILQIADNQGPISRAWQRCGYGVDLGPFDQLRSETLRQEMVSLMQDEARREHMAFAGQALVDGSGARRVARHLLSMEPPKGPKHEY